MKRKVAQNISELSDIDRDRIVAIGVRTVQLARLNAARNAAQRQFHAAGEAWLKARGMAKWPAMGTPTWHALDEATTEVYEQYRDLKDRSMTEFRDLEKTVSACVVELP